VIFCDEPGADQGKRDMMISADVKGSTGFRATAWASALRAARRGIMKDLAGKSSSSAVAWMTSIVNRKTPNS
jgi:hypothetical protein